MPSTPIEQHFQDSLRFFASALFTDVQQRAIFKDSKTFADAIPKIPLAEILHQYEIKRQNSGSFDLKTFVSHYFVLPTLTELTASQPGATVSEHINHLWTLLHKEKDRITAGSLLPLQYPYIVPGGRFQEIYYWDCYFSALGLMTIGRHSVVEAMLRNLVDLQSRYGRIPNGNRSYYYSRSQPPILALLTELLLPHHQGDPAFITYCVEALTSEYRFWMNGSEAVAEEHPAQQRVVLMPDGSLLNRYWDELATPRAESYREDLELALSVPPSQQATFYRNIRAACESGWDFSSRWLAEPDQLNSIRTTQILPIDLNCLLCQLETQLASYHLQLGQQQQSEHYQSKTSQRKAAIEKYLWSPEHGYFFDYDIEKQARTSIKSLAGVLPLFIRIATSAQAAQVASTIQSQFLQPGGLITTLVTSEQQWDAPNGWAPLHWFTVQGLNHYHFEPLATVIMQRWINTVEVFFAKSGKLMEKYNVCAPFNPASGGEYDVQEGFGWTNGVTQAFYHNLT